MIRIFSILSAFTIIMILVAGGGTYWISESDNKLAKEAYTAAIAKGLVLSISSEVNALQKTISKMAATPTVIAALESNDSFQLEQTANLLESVLPTVLKIRLLTVNISDLDETNVPHMGNADLVMVQQTLTKNQFPVIQGLNKNRHLAITAVIKKNEQAIGILLASLKFNFLRSHLKKLKLKEGYIELKQGNATLAKAGEASSKTDDVNSIDISKTSWKVEYWPPMNIASASIMTIAIIILLPVILTILFFFIIYRHIAGTLKHDQSSILKAVKDLMSGKSVESYPVKLKEMNAIISTIVQFKRVIDNEGNDLSDDNAGGVSDSFFGESSSISFMDTYIEENDESEFFQSTESSPISLPETEQQNSSDDSPKSSLIELPSKQAKIASTIFRAYDIRGIAGKTLNKEIVFDIGRAAGSEAKEKNVKTIVVGRDGRTSSKALTESLEKGIISTGVNVLNVGLVPSPVVYFVAQHTEGKSGIVITGSHNPPEYNGLKIIINNETLAGDKIQQLKQRIDNADFIKGETGTVEQNKMFTNEYIGVISEDIHIARPMKVVVDCGNGAAGEIAPILLKTIGCEVIELFCEIDGTFPNHHPDPSNPKNLSDLIAAVQHYEADVGVAFDGDGDRLGVIDSKGKIIWPDRLMMLFAKEVLSKKPNSEIIYDVKCTRHLSKQIESYGGHPTIWKTGHSFMKAKIKETGAILAGEMSGHIFFNDRWFGFDDGLYSASRLIEILSEDSRSSHEVFSDFPDSVNTPEISIELAEGENVQIMGKIVAAANFSDAETTTIDGLRVDFADGWGLVRASNTMPSLMFRFEADDVKGLKRIQSQFKELLIKIKPDLDLPF